ncbi:MAG: hypothetical protein AB7Q00_14715 [Phycisphaerales bacterium]
MKGWVAVATYVDGNEGIEPLVAVATTQEGALCELTRLVLDAVDDYGDVDVDAYWIQGEAKEIEVK